MDTDAAFSRIAEAVLSLQRVREPDESVTRALHSLQQLLSDMQTTAESSTTSQNALFHYSAGSSEPYVPDPMADQRVLLRVAPSCLSFLRNLLVYQAAQQRRGEERRAAARERASRLANACFQAAKLACAVGYGVAPEQATAAQMSQPVAPALRDVSQGFIYAVRIQRSNFVRSPAPVQVAGCYLEKVPEVVTTCADDIARLESAFHTRWSSAEPIYDDPRAVKLEDYPRFPAHTNLGKRLYRGVSFTSISPGAAFQPTPIVPAVYAAASGVWSSSSCLDEGVSAVINVSELGESFQKLLPSHNDTGRPKKRARTVIDDEDDATVTPVTSSPASMQWLSQSFDTPDAFVAAIHSICIPRVGDVILSIDGVVPRTVDHARTLMFWCEKEQKPSKGVSSGRATRLAGQDHHLKEQDASFLLMYRPAPSLPSNLEHEGSLIDSSNEPNIDVAAALQFIEADITSSFQDCQTEYVFRTRQIQLQATDAAGLETLYGFFSRWRDMANRPSSVRSGIMSNTSLINLWENGDRKDETQIGEDSLNTALHWLENRSSLPFFQQFVSAVRGNSDLMAGLKVFVTKLTSGSFARIIGNPSEDPTISSRVVNSIIVDDISATGAPRCPARPAWRTCRARQMGQSGRVYSTPAAVGVMPFCHRLCTGEVGLPRGFIPGAYCTASQEGTTQGTKRRILQAGVTMMDATDVHRWAVDAANVITLGQVGLGCGALANRPVYLHSTQKPRLPTCICCTLNGFVPWRPVVKWNATALRETCTAALEAVQESGLAFCTAEQSVYIPTLAMIRKVASFSGHRGHSVFCLTYDLGGRCFISGADDGLIKIWHADSGALQLTLRGFLDHIAYMAVSVDNRQIAACSDDATEKTYNIRLWTMSNGEPSGVLHGHNAEINDLKYDPVINVPISISDDGTLRVWDVNDSYNRVHDDEATRTVLDEAKSMDEDKLIVAADSRHGNSPARDLGGRDQAVLRHGYQVMISTATPESSRCCVRKFVDKAGNAIKLMSMDVAPSGGVAAVGGDDGTIRICSIARWADSLSTSTNFPIMAIDGESALQEVGGNDAPGQLAERVSLRKIPKVLQEMKIHGAGCHVTRLLFSHCGDKLLSSSYEDGSAALHEFGLMGWTNSRSKQLDVTRAAEENAMNQKSSTIPVRVHSSAWSAHDNYIFLSVMRKREHEENIPPCNRSPHLWANASTGQTTGGEPVVGLPAPFGSPTGSNAKLNIPPAISNGEAQKVRRCDPHVQVWGRNGQLLSVLRGHAHRIVSLVPHPSDEQILLTIGDDGRVIIFDVHNAIQLACWTLFRPNAEEDESNDGAGPVVAENARPTPAQASASSRRRLIVDDGTEDAITTPAAMVHGDASPIMAYDILFRPTDEIPDKINVTRVQADSLLVDQQAEHCPVYDAKWRPNDDGTPSYEFSVSDHDGRIHVFGLGQGISDRLQAARFHQYLSKDYDELIRDEGNNVLDATTQQEPHLVAQVLCDEQGSEYAIQPSVRCTEHLMPAALNDSVTQAHQYAACVRASLLFAMQKVVRNHATNADSVVSLDCSSALQQQIAIRTIMRAAKTLTLDEPIVPTPSRKQGQGRNHVSVVDTSSSDEEDTNGRPGGSRGAMARLRAVQRRVAAARHVPTNSRLAATATRALNAISDNESEEDAPRGGRHDPRSPTRRRRGRPPVDSDDDFPAVISPPVAATEVEVTEFVQIPEAARRHPFFTESDDAWESEIAGVTFTEKAATLPDGTKVPRKICGFCNNILQESANEALVLCRGVEGSFLPAPVRINRSTSIWVHKNCAVFSPRVRYDDERGWLNVRSEYLRGRQLTCAYQHCKSKGATIGCSVESCSRSYHFPCAALMGWQGWRGAVSEDFIRADIDALKQTTTRISNTAGTELPNVPYGRVYCPGHISASELLPIEPLVTRARRARRGTEAVTERVSRAGNKRPRRTTAGYGTADHSDSENAGDDDESFALSDSDSADERRRKNVKRARLQPAAAASRKNYVRSWLQYSSPPPLLYIPQVGDELVYIPEGHAEFVKEHDTDAPHHPFNRFPSSFPAVLARVEKLTFRFPEESEEDVARSAYHSKRSFGGKPAYFVLCDITMRFIAKEDGVSQDRKTVLWGEPRSSRVSSMPEIFSLTYCPADAGSADFLILRSRYEAAITSTFVVGEKVYVPYLSTDAQTNTARAWEESRAYAPPQQPLADVVIDGEGKVSAPLEGRGRRVQTRRSARDSGAPPVALSHPLEPEPPVAYGWHEYTPTGSVFEDARVDGKSHAVDVWESAFGYGVFDSPFPRLPRYFTRDAANTAYLEDSFEYVEAVIEEVGRSNSRRFPGSHWKTISVQFPSSDELSADAFCPWELQKVSKGDATHTALPAPHQADWLSPEGVLHLSSLGAVPYPAMTAMYTADGLLAAHCVTHPWTSLDVLTQFDRLPGIDRELGKQLIDAIRAFSGEPAFEAFFSPVSAELYPEYYRMIPLPVDLTLILKRLVYGFYRNVEGFRTDIELLRENCIAYNGDDHPLGDEAIRIHDRLSSMIGPRLEVPGSDTTASDDSWREDCLGLVRDLRRNRRLKWFVDPVDPALLPDYHTIIKSPMDFHTIETLLQRGVITDLIDFVTRLSLIWKNAYTYNRPGVVTEAADECKAVAESRLTDIGRKHNVRLRASLF